MTKKVGLSLTSTVNLLSKIAPMRSAPRAYAKNIKRLQTIAGHEVRDLQRKYPKKQGFLNYKLLLGRIQRVGSKESIRYAVFMDRDEMHNHGNDHWEQYDSAYG